MKRRAKKASTAPARSTSVRPPSSETVSEYVEILREMGAKEETIRLVQPDADDVPLCDRLVQHNSLRWSCACGAAGPVGRSADGIPYVDDEMLRHEPGATKE